MEHLQTDAGTRIRRSQPSRYNGRVTLQFQRRAKLSSAHAFGVAHINLPVRTALADVSRTSGTMVCVQRRGVIEDVTCLIPEWRRA